MVGILGSGFRVSGFWLKGLSLASRISRLCNQPQAKDNWKQLLYGALIIRIGFWGFLIIVIVYYTPKTYSGSSYGPAFTRLEPLAAVVVSSF